MTKRKAIKFTTPTHPSGGPGKSGRYTWEVWADNKKIDEGKTTGGAAIARAEANEALQIIQDHYEETGELKSSKRFKAGSFLGTRRKK
jgi:hypothetical protein